MLNVVDVSSWQSDCNVAALVDADCIIAKATEGTDYKNPCFENQIKTARKAGKLVGAYHYASKGDAKAQAAYFAKVAGSYLTGDCIAVLDWEGSATQQGTDWAVTWLKEVERLTGVKPMIYMSQSVCSTFKSVPNGAGLWVAYYPPVTHPPFSYRADFGKSIKPWDFMAMWQYCSDGRIKGYSSNLDLSHFYGDKSAWKAYAKVNKTTNTSKTDKFKGDGYTITVQFD